ncbi:hypothetical protein [Echinicola vietnamensis]|uniref:Outer membrane protein beta-barrel domain-containing protein n=1 Tax=Echinicola vietnamensis (strain DSM 17526 / LMG 23754 / KMM 6221) TaxID=926556 RepID=L0FWT9_ECHVK|nr:hypothetical protein [Echinicola vietnamensis]AGA77777.1 hypothetical protein Echvi_1512 [Echinicola vietnamensis DSM 17526]
MIKKAIITAFVVAVMVVSHRAEAQTYSTGVGLRAGVSNGLTVKHFISLDEAIEGILHTRWKGLVITGLYEKHKDIREVRGLKWFYGGGAHLGTWGDRSDPPFHDYDDSYTVFGIDGIIGLDYKFVDAPINLSLDYKPAFNITDDVGWWGDEIALSIRFTFH